MRSEPEEVIHWSDPESAAVGWIVLDRTVNGVAGGGLFMHSNATVDEVADLAATMSYKHLLTKPQVGGGKGGIRFDPRSPDANAVLRRFMLANRETIAHRWSTGADLFTSNEVIDAVARTELGLSSSFSAIGAMVAKANGIPPQDHNIHARISTAWRDSFTLGSCAAGHSVAKSVELVAGRGPHRVAIQGFGNVGSSAAFFLQSQGPVESLAICEEEGFLVGDGGVDVEALLAVTKSGNGNASAALRWYAAQSPSHTWHERIPDQSDEEALMDFVSMAAPQVFIPCAKRYVISQRVIESLARSECTHIVCGANNAFADTALANEAEARGMSTLPEWISNSGNAILFSEVLSRTTWSRAAAEEVFSTTENRISEFIDTARHPDTSLRRGCLRYANTLLTGALTG